MDASMSSEDTHELHCRVHGRVQGVMFRDFCQRQARSSRLTGWVKNNSDGTVSLCVRGNRASLEQYLEKLYKGSILARVGQVDVEWVELNDSLQDFVILYE